MRAWTSTVSFVACVLCVSVIAGCPAPPAVEDAFIPEVDGGGGRDVGLDAPECGSDAECDDGLFCSGIETCTLGRCVPGPVACDDGIDCTIDACDESLRRCANEVPDVDADGYGDAECLDAAGVPLGNDCADDDLTTFPGNHETCDELGHDEDCDPSTHGDTDADSDGYESIACCNPDPLGGSPLCGLDCDDARAATSPIGTETCDGLDQNCDGDVDEGTLLDGFEDLDFDGYGGLTEAHRCAAAVGFARVGGDCDDANPSANPGLPELCDVGAPVDNNCDGSTTDTPGTTEWYDDDDGDGFGSAASGVTISCEPVANASLRDTDCNDARADVNPSQAERCDGLDDDCNGTADFLIGPNNFEDDDGDLLVDIACVPTGTDCDDTNPATGPGERESCDGRDNDCDTRIDEGATSLVYYRDGDADGFGSVTSGTIVACMTSVGYVARAGDCNDADATRFPGASELCDAGDNDCDSAIDEAPASASCAPIAHTVIACLSGGRCGIDACESGYSDCNHDPSDGCEAMGSGPGTPDVCDGADNDCDSRIDEDAPTRVYYRDLDGDGFGSTTSGSTIACSLPTGHVTVAGDCVDTDATRFPGASETCDAGDNDCDSAIDEAPASAACVLANAIEVCAAGACAIGSCTGGFADCNHVASDGCEAFGTGPGTPDVCDGVDNDCDSRFDEDASTRVFYRDADVDTYGSATSGTVISCMAPAGYVAGAGDCNDSDATRHPGASELCDAGDNDCDSAVDEAPATASCGAIANGVAGCLSGGRCGVASCAAAFADCNADSTDGCESQLTTDVNHCGTCAIDCNDAPRVTAAVCEASGCRITGCALGYQDCDGFAGNGCEIGTSSDPLHCGSCTGACGVSQVCSAGTCALACAPGLIVCDGQCVNPQSDVSYCGATGACGMGSGSRGAICRPGEACASGACFASFISPGIDAVSMTWPRDVTYTIDAPGAATIFYTLDGTVPGVSGSTVTAAAPVSLMIGGLSGEPPTPRIVRWVAQFGGGGTETIVHEVRIGWSYGYARDLGEIPELLNMNGGGPVIAVAPGAAVSGSVSLQHWQSDPEGYCPTCVVQANLGVDGVGQIECHYMGGPSYPGTTMTYGFSFTAPTTPGRYYVRAGMPLDFTCAGHAGGGPIGVIYVR